MIFILPHINDKRYQEEPKRKHVCKSILTFECSVCKVHRQRSGQPSMFVALAFCWWFRPSVLPLPSPSHDASNCVIIPSTKADSQRVATPTKYAFVLRRRGARCGNHNAEAKSAHAKDTQARLISATEHILLATTVAFRLKTCLERYLAACLRTVG